MSQNSPRIVHLQWSGPLTWKEKDKLNGPTDYGIYQIYGCHPIYGVDVLLYIGKAYIQKFATRLKAEEKQELNWIAHQDFERLSVYVGRCYGWEGTPSDEEWKSQVDLAEKLLIWATMPSHNAQKRIDMNDPGIKALHVFNWGCYRSLPPEASGRRWSSEFYHDDDKYLPFTTDDATQPKQNV
jgi:hypothetical protein